MAESYISDVASLVNEADRLKAALQGEKRTQLVNLLNSDNATPEQIAAILPDSQIKLLFSLSLPPVIDQLLPKIPPDVRANLEQLRVLIQKELPNVLNSAVFWKAATKVPHSASGTELATEPDFEFNRIQKVNVTSFLAGDAPDLVPILRLGIINENNKLAFDTTLDWDDVLKLANTLVSVVLRDVARVEKIAASKLLAPGASPMLSHHAQSLLASAQKLLEAHKNFEN